jgi:hypothetical protein
MSKVTSLPVPACCKDSGSTCGCQPKGRSLLPDGSPKGRFSSHEKLCISPIPLHFWDAVYFDIFRSVRRHEKYSVLVKMQSFTYSTFYCILKCSAFSPNSAFGNAEIENAVSAERTLSVDEPCSIINSVKPHSLQRTLQFHASELCQGS